MVSKSSIIKTLTICLSFHLCDAEGPIFHRPKRDGDKVSNNQFIIEFQRNMMGEESRQILLNEDEDAPRLIRRIESRNIFVVKFKSRIAVARWLKQAKGVKYFERGENLYYT